MVNFKNDINDIGERVTHIESKLGEFATSFNDMVDVHHEKKKKMMDWVKAKNS